MATLEQLQKQLDDRSLDPSKLNNKQKTIIDELINRGDLKGPSISEIENQRNTASEKIAREEEYYKDPIAAALKAEDSFFKGRPTAELAGDLTGSIAPYVTMRKKIFGAAKSGNLWVKGPGKLTQAAANVADKLPGRFKLLGGALKLLARVADVPGKVIQSPIGRAEIYSVLGGSGGAGVGSITYDMLNEQAGNLIANTITDEFANVPEKEIKQDIMLNALEATRTAAYWNAGAAALTPFISGPLGKLGSKLFGTKGDKAKELAMYARDKGLPLPLNTAIEGGLLGDMGKNYFKTVGVFPFVSSIGRKSLQQAEQEAGKQFLNSLLAFGPIMKTSALSSSIYNQAAKVFSERSALIGAKYKAFDTLAETVGNPKVIRLTNTNKRASEFLQQNASLFPELSAYVRNTEIPIKDINKLLKMEGDPLNLLMKAVYAIENNAITPMQYKGLMQMMNRAIEGTEYQNIRASIWGLREAMENDLNSFGANLTKDNFLKDENIKKTYETMVSSRGKEFADSVIANQIKDAEGLYSKLYDANATFSSIMGFYQKMGLPRKLRAFDSTLFTNKGVNNILGTERISRDQIFQTMERDVFESNSPDAIEQFKVLLGSGGSKATENGKRLFEAAKARYMFNAFLSSFETAGSPAARSIFKDVIGTSPGVKAGTEYAQDAISKLGTEELQAARQFSIEDVRLNNGIYDLKDIRFSPDDFADFNINKFMNKLGIGEATSDIGREKMVKLLGENGTNEFYKFTNYMKAISDIPVSDTSTFLQRRLQLGSFKSVAGGMVAGAGMFTVNPFAPVIFLLLARRAGRMLSDPVAIRYMNDALLPDEVIRALKGKKVGFDTRLPIAPRLRKINPLQKREAFAKLLNYMADEDKDLPRVNPKTVDPLKIQEELLNQPFRIEQPKYQEKNLPTDTVESMFTQDFTGSSGNVETDNQMVNYLNSTIKNAKETEVEANLRDIIADREQVDASVDLVDPNEAMQESNPDMTNYQAPMQPNTGQVTPQSVQALFPNDPTSALIAARRQGQS
jgi:hypothetical protein